MWNTPLQTPPVKQSIWPGAKFNKSNPLIDSGTNKTEI